jgi:hypothetical protein
LRFNGSIFGDDIFFAVGFFVAVFADLAEAFGLAVTRADFLLADFFFAAFAMY